MVAALRHADRLLLTTHENPDGDALGSLLAMHGILEQLGKDALMYMSPDEFPLPWEYRNWTFDRLVGAPPDDLDERTIVFLDCGNIDRMPVDFLQREGLHILNIDHHHDNTRFGTVNFVVPEASCTAEIVWRLAKELGAELTPEIADALYTGLVTDTGRFMYENTERRGAPHGGGPDRRRGGAAQGVPSASTRTCPSAGSSSSSARSPPWSATTTARSRVAHLVKADYEETGALETDSEGVIDHLRAVQGTAVAVLVRELLGDDRGGMRKVSLRATDGRVDVSRIARAYGGGGHTQAAGFTTDMSYPRVGGAAARAGARAARRLVAAAGVLLYPKPAGVTSHDVVARVRRDLERGRQGRATRARSTRSPPACCSCSWAAPRARSASCMGLPKTYRAVARLGWRSDTGDRDGELEHTGRMPERLELPTGELMQRPPAYSAVKVGGRAPPTGWRAAARRVELDPRARSPCTGPSCSSTTPSGRRFEIECSAGTYVRSLIEELGDAYCEELERTRIGPFRLEDADPGRLVRLAEALAFLPERALDEDEAEAVGHGRRLPAPASPRRARAAHPGRASWWPSPSPAMASSSPS